MEVAIVIIICVVGFLVGRSVYQRRNSELSQKGEIVILGDLPGLVESINSTGSNGAYFELSIPETERGDEWPASLQMSIDDDILGIDWVLLSERNIEDKFKFIDLIHEFGLIAIEARMNDVDYLRVEEVEDFAELAMTILQRLYGLTENSSMELSVEQMERIDRT